MSQQLRKLHKRMTRAQQARRVIKMARRVPQIFEVRDGRLVAKTNG